MSPAPGHTVDDAFKPVIDEVPIETIYDPCARGAFGPTELREFGPTKLRVTIPLGGSGVNPTFATRGIEAAKLEVFHSVRSKGRHHTGRCHGAATSTEAILGDG